MPDYYVDLSRGNDGNDGLSSSRALRTITEATLRAADAGGSGTIHVAAGVYRASTIPIGAETPTAAPPGCGPPGTAAAVRCPSRIERRACAGGVQLSLHRRRLIVATCVRSESSVTAAGRRGRGSTSDRRG